MAEQVATVAAGFGKHVRKGKSDHIHYDPLNKQETPMPTTKKKPAAKKKPTSPSTNSGVIVMEEYNPCTMKDGILSQIADDEDRAQVFFNISSARAAVRRTQRTRGDHGFWFVRLTS